MSSKSATVTKCYKPKGSYCKIHNPAGGQSFQTVNDVFKKLDQQTTKSATAVHVPVPAASKYDDIAFQNINELRTLAPNIPLSIEEHVLQSRADIEAKGYTREQRLALTGYTGFAAGTCNTVLLGNEYEYYDEAPPWKETEGPCDFVNREELVEYMETIDTVLQDRQEERRVVYRGIPIYEAIHNEIGKGIGKNLTITDTEGLVAGLHEYYKVGKTFNFATYLSTTHSAQYAAERTQETTGTKDNGYYSKPAEIKGIQFELKTNAGLDVTGLARSHFAREREVVLPRDTHFKVTGVYVKPTEYRTESGFDDWRHPDEQEAEDFKKLAVVVQMVEVDKDGNEITHTQPHKPSKAIEDIIAK